MLSNFKETKVIDLKDLKICNISDPAIFDEKIRKNLKKLPIIQVQKKSNLIFA